MGTSDELSHRYLWFEVHVPLSLASRWLSDSWERSNQSFALLYKHTEVPSIETKYISLLCFLRFPLPGSTLSGHLPTVCGEQTYVFLQLTHLKWNGFCFYLLLLLQWSSSAQRPRQDSYLARPLTLDIISTS